MQNKMLPNLRQIHSVPPFKTYVKSNASKIYPHLQRHRQLFETYVKLLTSKTEGMLLNVYIMFETYVKSNASKP